MPGSMDALSWWLALALFEHKPAASIGSIFLAGLLMLSGKALAVYISQPQVH